MQNTTHSTLTEFMENLAFNNPNQVISSFKDEINVFTVKELNNHANLLAKGLLYNGVSKGTPVALVIAGTTSCLTFALAIAKIGAILIPINQKMELTAIGKILKEQKVHTIAFYADPFLKLLLNIVPNLTQSERGYLKSKDLPELKNIITLGSVKSRGLFTTRELMLVGSHMDDIEMEDTLVSIQPSDVFIHKVSFGDKGKVEIQEFTHEAILHDNFSFPALQNFLLNSI